MSAPKTRPLEDTYAADEWDKGYSVGVNDPQGRNVLAPSGIYKNPDYIGLHSSYWQAGYWAGRNKQLPNPYRAAPPRAPPASHGTPHGRATTRARAPRYQSPTPARSYASCSSTRSPVSSSASVAPEEYTVRTVCWCASLQLSRMWPLLAHLC